MEQRDQQREDQRRTESNKPAVEEEEAEVGHLNTVDDLEDEEEETMGDDDMRTVIGTRAEKSLGLLTRRFLQLLQSARGGIVDLNTVSCSMFFFVLLFQLMLFETFKSFLRNGSQVFFGLFFLFKKSFMID